MQRHTYKAVLSVLISFVLSAALLAAQESNVYQQGIASWYGGEFQGKLTANGEIFDTHSISAAHKTLPFGTIVKVTNQTNGLSVEVRINDRGPFVEERIIDLSKAAAQQIDMVDQGIAPVTLEVLYKPETPESAYNRVEDAQFLNVQIGAYSSVRGALEVYKQLNTLGIQPQAEITEGKLIRIQLRNIPSHKHQEYIEKLESAGFTDVLVRSAPGNQ
ncbi:MAG: septal ring lytic transglycosylase RlpA family protein [Spirochaetota bacterium]